MKKNKPISIAGEIINPGERKIIEIPTASLYTQTSVNLPVHIIHGKDKGPCLFVNAAMHGDEVNGIEIIRLLLKHPGLKKLCGTLIAIPIANIYGFITLSRYLPDRRDLNRSFPGSKNGSLAARLANLLMEEIVSKCTHVIDLHTGNIHVDNLPQIRTNLDTKDALKLARAFNVPVIVNSKLRDGSLRQAASELGIPTLIYEGGEALRFSEISIQAGLRGVLRVMHMLKMMTFVKLKSTKTKSRISYHTEWLRSPKSGIIHPFKKLGSYVKKNEPLGIIADPFAKEKEFKIIAPFSGVIIGKNSLPMLNEGDALFHIAIFKEGEAVTSEFNVFLNNLIDNPIAIL